MFYKKIEQCVFFGILQKNVPIKSNNYLTSRKTKYLYKFYKRFFGVIHHNYSGKAILG